MMLFKLICYKTKKKVSFCGKACCNFQTIETKKKNIIFLMRKQKTTFLFWFPSEISLVEASAFVLF
jgi:hypothetical protein